MARDRTELNVAPFTDFEDLVRRTGIEPAQFDLQPGLDRLLERGKIVFPKACADWPRFAPARAHLHDKGVELVDVPPGTRAGKNAADIRLVIDALELACQRDHADAFALASGDSVFCPLAYELREIGRTVIGLSVRESTSPLFVNACHGFVYLTPGKKKPEPQKKRSEHKAKQAGTDASPGGRKHVVAIPGIASGMLPIELMT